MERNPADLKSGGLLMLFHLYEIYFFDGDNMAKYLVCGEIKLGKTSRKFEKAVEAENDLLASEKVMCLFGSNAGIKRQAIKIDSIEKLV